MHRTGYLFLTFAPVYDLRQITWHVMRDDIIMISITLWVYTWHAAMEMTSSDISSFVEKCLRNFHKDAGRQGIERVSSFVFHSVVSYMHTRDIMYCSRF